MAYTGQLSTTKRALSGGATLFAAALVGTALVNGLDLRVIREVSEAISAVSIRAPKPPAEPPKPEPAPNKTAKASSPANRHAKAAPVLATKPKYASPKPPTIAAAPQPGTGSASSAGAASVDGPGSGPGGNGDGSGAGVSKAVWRSGEIRNRDYPKSASQAKVGGVVETRFTILPSGRVTGCRVSRSSGDVSLDSTTCRLIEQRFRFKPATNSAGSPIASSYGWRQTWWLERKH